MAITNISRDWGDDPSIVRVITTDNLATITTAGYLTTQKFNIDSLNSGVFEWRTTDYVLISYSDGQGFFTRNIITETFVAAPNSTGSLIQYFRTGMSPAQFIDAYDNPFLILPAPGANKLILINRYMLILEFVSVQYTLGNDVGLQYGNDAHLTGHPAAEGIVGSSDIDDAVENSAFYGSGSFGPFSFGITADAVNKGIYLSTDVKYATGNSPFDMHIWYSIIDVNV